MGPSGESATRDRAPKVRGRVMHQDIASDLGERIARGEFDPNAPIPSLRELVAEYGAARATVQRALGTLIAAGRLRSAHGVGTFVSDGCPLQGVVVVTVFGENMDSIAAEITTHDVIEGARRACSEIGAPLISACDSDDPARYVRKGYGFVLSFSDMRRESYAVWTRAVLDARAPASAVLNGFGFPNCVGRDKPAGVRRGLRYLYALGHRRVAMVSRANEDGFPFMSPEPIEDAPGLEVETVPVHYRRKDHAAQIRDNFKAFDRALDRPDPPTALFVACRAAQDAMGFLHDAGLDLPGAISLLGYCRGIFAEWNERRITHVDNPYFASGARAVHEVARMARGGGYQTGHLLLKPEIVEGDTCGPPAPEPARPRARVPALW